MISIIVPVYNVEPYLRQSLESILHQTYSNIEILLIDDGSTDRSGEICEEYAQANSRIKVFHTKNNGLSAARNLGLQEAKGEYIGFVDSDDWIEPTMYEVLLHRLMDTGADISVCEIWMEDSSSHYAGQSVQNAVYTGADSVRALILSLQSYVWNKLYKKKCWTNLCFPVGHSYEDVSTLYKVILNANIVSSTSERLFHHRLRNDSISHTYSMENVIDRWNAYYDRFLFMELQPQVYNDQECITIMKERLAEIIITIWNLSCDIPAKERNYDLLRMISNFVRKHIPLFGYVNLGLRGRIVLLFANYPNNVSLSCLHILKNIFTLLKKCLH